MGFKGYNSAEQNADIGYRIKRKRQGYAEEAVSMPHPMGILSGIIKEITAEAILIIMLLHYYTKLNFVEMKIEMDEELFYWSLK